MPAGDWDTVGGQQLTASPSLERIVILGRGGAGKSTLARRLGALTGFPVAELDQWFWQPGLVATPRDRWIEIQDELIQGKTWIIEGDLGPHDVLEPRLEVADTVIILDFSLLRCAWRTIRRSGEGIDFWRWVIGYRRRSLPALMATLAKHAPRAQVYLLRTPPAAEALLAAISTGRPITDVAAQGDAGLSTGPGSACA